MATPIGHVAALAVALLVAACASRPTSAPVVDRGATSASRGASQGATAAGVHVVQRGETLYSIALEHGVDYRDLAAWNGLGDGTHIRVGQALQLGPRGTSQAAATLPKGVDGSLGLDSLDFIELSVAIEERFGITIDETQDLSDEFLSLDSLSRFILARTGQE